MRGNFWDGAFPEIQREFPVALMRIYLKNKPAEFHLNPIWNDGAWGFFEDGRPNNKNNNKIWDQVLI